MNKKHHVDYKKYSTDDLINLYIDCYKLCMKSFLNNNDKYLLSVTHFNDVYNLQLKNIHQIFNIITDEETKIEINDMFQNKKVTVSLNTKSIEIRYLYLSHEILNYTKPVSFPYYSSNFKTIDKATFSKGELSENKNTLRMFFDRLHLSDKKFIIKYGLALKNDPENIWKVYGFWNIISSKIQTTFLFSKSNSKYSISSYKIETFESALRVNIKEKEEYLKKAKEKHLKEQEYFRNLGKVED